MSKKESQPKKATVKEYKVIQGVAYRKLNDKLTRNYVMRNDERVYLHGFEAGESVTDAEIDKKPNAFL